MRLMEIRGGLGFNENRSANHQIRSKMADDIASKPHRQGHLPVN
jgi:hypothetical protein